MTNENETKEREETSDEPVRVVPLSPVDMGLPVGERVTPFHTVTGDWSSQHLRGRQGRIATTLGELPVDATFRLDVGGKHALITFMVRECEGQLFATVVVDKLREPRRR